MAKSVIMGVTMALVLGAIVWMWRVDALSGGEEASRGRVDAPGDLPQLDRGEEGGGKVDANALPELVAPCTLKMPREATLDELVERYYWRYYNKLWPFLKAEQFKSGVARKLLRANALPDTQTVLPAGMEVFLPRIYVVLPEDNLTKIAAKVYGDGSKSEKIFRANTDVISKREFLKAGWILVIPE